jgi:hypothetical protein
MSLIKVPASVSAETVEEVFKLGKLTKKEQKVVLECVTAYADYNDYILSQDNSENCEIPSETSLIQAHNCAWINGYFIEFNWVLWSVLT